MDITKTVVALREQLLAFGDYVTYRTQLSGKLLNSRHKLNIASKNRGKYHPLFEVTAQQIAESHEYGRLQLLTAERAWADAMAVKAAHSTDTKGILNKTRSHIVSRLQKAAKTAQRLANTLQDAASGASPHDVLEAQAYAALLKGAAQFEKNAWQAALTSYAVARMIYSALASTHKADIFKDLLSDTIDPSIRYAAYKISIPRSQPIPAIARDAFPHSDSELFRRIASINQTVLKQGDQDAEKYEVPTTLTWRKREVKIEDASIAAAWARIETEKAQLAEKLVSSTDLEPKEEAGLYDDILVASQDAVDATKSALDGFRSEGVGQSDPRMQSLQITRTAVNYGLISWRIGRNRALMGSDDGAKPVNEFRGGRKRSRKFMKQGADAATPKEVVPGRQLAKLREKVVLYDGTLQNVEFILELAGVANDQGLVERLNAISQYFTALKCLALARSHLIAGNTDKALALIKHALNECESACSILSAAFSEPDSAPRNIEVSARLAQSLRNLLQGELQRARALVEFSRVKKLKQSGAPLASRPLVERLHEYPAEGLVDLDSIVIFPPQVETIPVKPIFLDVAWNYIDYPSAKGTQSAATAQNKAATGEAKPQKKGWFSFGN